MPASQDKRISCTLGLRHRYCDIGWRSFTSPPARSPRQCWAPGPCPSSLGRGLTRRAPGQVPALPLCIAAGYLPSLNCSFHLESGCRNIDLPSPPPRSPGLGLTFQAQRVGGLLTDATTVCSLELGTRRHCCRPLGVPGPRRGRRLVFTHPAQRVTGRLQGGSHCSLLPR